MVSAERTVRLPLNASESRETSTGRFLTTALGAGVQHIALTSDDTNIPWSNWRRTGRGCCQYPRTTTKMPPRNGAWTTHGSRC
jgi:4-hydroxyphenylpyruvate dioxygenase-like putative hemolysin